MSKIIRRITVKNSCFTRQSHHYVWCKLFRMLRVFSVLFKRSGISWRYHSNAFTIHYNIIFNE